ncbi:Uncharacterised protein [uncultured archaeon]|nr:Uncharacterised protein [uncultured archaeon]
MLGVPALLILMLSIASQFGYGWQHIGIIVGLYLLLKGFGIDESLGQMVGEFNFSIDKTSWIAYIAAVALLAVSGVAMYQSYLSAVAIPLYGEKIAAYVLSKSVLLIMPWALLLILVGKALDARTEKRKFVITRYALYGSAIVLTAMMLKIGSDWVLNLEPPYVSFSDFLLTIALSVVAGYVAIQAIRIIREEALGEMKLEGKEAIGESGTYIGKVVGVNMKEGFLVVQTPFERKMNITIDDITSVADKVVVKQ